MTPGQKEASVEAAAKKVTQKSSLAADRALTLAGSISAVETAETLTIRFDGGRLATANDILAMSLRNRMVYKRRIKAAISAYFLVTARESARALSGDRPLGLTLIRQVPTKRERVDFDALAFMFKHVLDGLRICGILPDDNPEIVSAPVVKQPIGPYLLELVFCKAGATAAEEFAKASDRASGECAEQIAQPRS